MIKVSLGSFPRPFDARKVNSAISPLFKVREGHLREAVAAASGFNTHAAMLAAGSSSAPLSFPVLSARLAQLAPDKNGEVGTARAIAALFEGATFDIEINKHPEAVYARHTHVQYEVTVRLTSPDGARASHDFLLPEFFVAVAGSSARVEPYRVVSRFSHRTHRPERQSKTRKDGGETLFAKFVDGEWRGELLVYSQAHQDDDRSCMKAVAAALARAVLPGCSQGVRCEVYRPTSYDYGAWRVELSLGSGASSFCRGDLTFSVPAMDKRLFVPESGYRGNTGNISDFKFVDGRCLLDVYTNGVSEDDSPTPVWMIRNKLLSAVAASLENAGWRHLIANI